MPFGLTNALAIFQHMMNDIFWEYLNQFMVAYLDDILIYSPDLDTHEEHIRLVCCQDFEICILHLFH